jgi:hypothetical protein
MAENRSQHCPCRSHANLASAAGASRESQNRYDVTCLALGAAYLKRQSESSGRHPEDVVGAGGQEVRVTTDDQRAAERKDDETSAQVISTLCECDQSRNRKQIAQNQ